MDELFELLEAQCADAGLELKFSEDAHDDDDDDDEEDLIGDDDDDDGPLPTGGDEIEERDEL